LRETMKEKLPDEIVWRRDKTGFEPPQQQWVENKDIQELIIAAKQKLIDEKIINPEVINKRIEAKPAHESNNYDWRYLTSYFLLK